jgi:hypothetical protein
MMPAAARWLRAAGLGPLEGQLQARRAAWPWAILAAAFVARIVVAAVFTNFDPASAELWEYGSIARATIEHGHGQMVAPVLMALGHPVDPHFVYPTAFMPPVFVFVWMALFRLFGVAKSALVAMTALDVLAGVGVVYYSIRVARALFGCEVAALVVGIVMALHPVFSFSVATYDGVNIYILLLLIVFDLSLSTRRQTYALSLVVGVLAGIAALIRTEYLVLVGAVILGSLITHRQWKMAAVAAIAASVVIAPWTARNYVVFHRFVPIANSMGYNLFKGFDPEANGSGWWVDNHHVAERLLGRELSAVPLNRNFENTDEEVYYRAAIDYIESHPLRSFLVLPIYKAVLFWGFDIYERKTHELLYQLQFWPLFLLSIFGLVMAARDGYLAQPDHRTVMVLFAFQTLVIMSYAVHARYRMNVEPFLYAYAAVGALGVWGRLRGILLLRIVAVGRGRRQRLRSSARAEP